VTGPKFQNLVDSSSCAADSPHSVGPFVLEPVCELTLLLAVSGRFDLVRTLSRQSPRRCLRPETSGWKPALSSREARKRGRESSFVVQQTATAATTTVSTSPSSTGVVWTPVPPKHQAIRTEVLRRALRGEAVRARPGRRVVRAPPLPVTVLGHGADAGEWEDVVGRRQWQVSGAPTGNGDHF
jgi:hypothetical protein